MLPQQYCLRWKYHHTNLQTMFSKLLDQGCFCDVTLACEGQTIRAHRVVLCACSTYFEHLLTNCSTEKDPIIIMRDAKFEDIKCLIEFMYKGEINVEHGSLASLLKTAEELRIKGLAEVSWRDEDNSSTSGSDVSGNNNNNNSLSVKNGNAATSGSSSSGSGSTSNNNSNNNNNNNNSIKIVETKKLLAPNFSSLARSSSLTPLTVSSLESRISDSPNLPLLTPLAAGSPRNPASCASPINYFSNKKKRGRPPLDEEYDTFQQLPKISHVEGGAGSSTPFTSSSQLVAVMMDDSSNEQTRDEPQSQSHHQQQQQQHQQQLSLSAASASYLEQQSRTLASLEFDEDKHIPRKMIPKMERPDTPQEYLGHIGPKFEYDDQSPPSPNDHNNSVFLTPQEQEEWKDVIKMNDYLTKGRRPQFWEEPFTKRVMDGIKNKTLEMKKAAKLLGVSYGTLYGRYRETYGCLKHPYRGPFMAASRMGNMWPTAADAGVANTTDILSMLQRGIITLPRAAELMHTTPSTISSYLEQLQEAAASQSEHDHLAALAAASIAEDDRVHQHLSLMSSQLEQQQSKPEISISPLAKKSVPSSSSGASSSAAATSVFSTSPTASSSSANVSGSSSSSNSLVNALSAIPSTSAAAQLSTNT